MRIFKTPRAEIPDDAMEAYMWRDARMKEEQEGRIDDEGGGRPGGSIESGGDEFDQMKAEELKLLCKEYGLKVSGKKAELQQRLRGHFQLSGSGGGPGESMTRANNTVDDYDGMSVKDLRDACNARGMSSTGKKAALVRELREDDAQIREITAEYMTDPSSSSSSPSTDLSFTATHRKISELLEEAAASGENEALRGILADIKAKNAEEPKYVDIKVTSLGMEPDAFTVSGAPSATSDVLRKLAGDPFADPPKYGKVRRDLYYSVLFPRIDIAKYTNAYLVRDIYTGIRLLRRRSKGPRCMRCFFQSHCDRINRYNDCQLPHKVGDSSLCVSLSLS